MGESLADSPTYAKNTILSLARRAEGGSREAAEALARWLEKYPDMRPLVRELADLATRVERAWVERMCGADELSRKAVEDDLAAMRAEMLGPSPSVTDKILAASVLVAHLSYQRAALAASRRRTRPACGRPASGCCRSPSGGSRAPSRGGRCTPGRRPGVCDQGRSSSSSRPTRRCRPRRRARLTRTRTGRHRP